MTAVPSVGTSILFCPFPQNWPLSVFGLVSGYVTMTANLLLRMPANGHYF